MACHVRRAASVRRAGNIPLCFAADMASHVWTNTFARCCLGILAKVEAEGRKKIGSFFFPQARKIFLLARKVFPQSKKVFLPARGQKNLPSANPRPAAIAVQGVVATRKNPASVILKGATRPEESKHSKDVYGIAVPDSSGRVAPFRMTETGCSLFLLSHYTTRAVVAPSRKTKTPSHTRWGFELCPEGFEPPTC